MHFKHRFNSPTGYYSGSLSNLESGTLSLPVRTVKDGSEPLTIHTFFLQGLTSMAFVDICFFSGVAQCESYTVARQRGMRCKHARYLKTREALENMRGTNNWYSVFSLLSLK